MTLAAVATFAVCLALSLRGLRWASSTALTHREADRIAFRLGPDWSALDVKEEEARGRLDDMFALLDKNR